MNFTSAPAWVKDSVFYQIFPDRFARRANTDGNGFKDWHAEPTSSGFHGGDLFGVAEKLDYLANLGVNGIYFTPVFQSASNHRYHTHDYFNVDPLLGGDEALKTLLAAAHKCGMKVVLDGVFNHASRGFFQFNHILECGPESPYADWFTVHGYPLNAYDGKCNYIAWHDIAALPKFNYKNPAVRAYILDIARHWLEFGIDGWRLDVPAEVDPSFWPEFRKVARAANPNAYIVGEIWSDEVDHTSVPWLTNDNFDAVMNYGVQAACLNFFIGSALPRREIAWQTSLRNEVLDGAAFAKRLTHILSLYPHEVALAQYNLLESHDTPRFLHLAGGNKNALKLAYFFLFTFPGAPSVYYGSEAGLSGGSDPQCRRAMPWSDDLRDNNLAEYFRSLAGMRRSSAALRRGTFAVVRADADTVAFTRTAEGETVLVILNNADSARAVTLNLTGELQKAAAFSDMLSGRRLTPSGDSLKLELPAKSGLALRAER